VVAVEELMPRQRLVENDPGREEIGAPIERQLLRLLGREIRELALQRSARRSREPRGGLRDAEIDEAARPVDADEDIVGADVAMDDLEGLPAQIDRIVRRLQPSEQIGDDARYDRRREQPLLIAEEPQKVRERHRLDVLLDEEELALAGIVGVLGGGQ